MTRKLLVMVLALLGAAGPALAQGQQSGTLGGRLTSSDGLALPGATVSVASGALQGERVTVTDVNGVYSLPGLPPGSYAVTFEMDGLATVERQAQVSLGGVVAMDQVLSPARVSEVVNVHGSASGAGQLAGRRLQRPRRRSSR